ncbi:MAG: hypothetical protein OEZ58_04130 [Gammaproteobacteria bacterium]|nr:hypothetical protein [Gammaproteobacteria bacterium]MDH5728152.1 hypothetical protein [Gammaproteobacteria bacterium]
MNAIAQAVQVNKTIEQMRLGLAAATHLSTEEKKKIVQVCLLNAMKERNQQEAGEFFEQLMMSLDASTQEVLTVAKCFLGPASNASTLDENAMARLQQVVVKLAGGVGADDDNQLLLQLENAVSQLSKSLHQAANKHETIPLPLIDLADLIRKRNRDHDLAIESAAQESFDRILNSVNPEAAKNYMDPTSVKVGPFYKASLYEAVVEKYQQLAAYHEKGRLARDFRAMYKSHLKKRSTQ